MRTSERIAAGALIVVTLPALLAFPAFAAVALYRAWPHLGVLERVAFVSATTWLGVVVPRLFRHRLALFWRGEAAPCSLADQFLIVAPISIAGWALTHQWFVPIGFAYLKVMVWAMKRIDRVKLTKASPLGLRQGDVVAPRWGSSAPTRRWIPRRRW